MWRFFLVEKKSAADVRTMTAQADCCTSSQFTDDQETLSTVELLRRVSEDLARSVVLIDNEDSL